MSSKTQKFISVLLIFHVTLSTVPDLCAKNFFSTNQPRVFLRRTGYQDKHVMLHFNGPNWVTTVF